MANVRGIRAGKAFVELFLDQSRLTRGLLRALRTLTALQHQFYPLHDIPMFTNEAP